MDALLSFLEAHGYLTLFLLGFAEFAGLPVAAVPIVLAAGALAGSGVIDPVLVALCVAAGGLLADTAWYSLARWRGSALVDSACGLSANPRVCVLGVGARIERMGAPYLLAGKFIPGVSGMLAAAAGFARMGRRRFLFWDLLALSLWAGTYTGLGWILADDIGPLIAWAADHGDLVLALVALLVGAAGLARLLKLRGHGDHPVEAGVCDS